MAGDSAISSVPPLARQAVRGLEHARSVQRLAERDLRPEHRQQALVVPRLLDEVLRAAAHRFDGDARSLPQAVITTIGVCASNARIRAIGVEALRRRTWYRACS